MGVEQFFAKNPAVALQIMGVQGALLVALLAILFWFLRRVLKEVTTRLAAGDACFDDLRLAVSRLAVVALAMCKVLQSDGRSLDCDQLWAVLVGQKGGPHV